MLERCRKIQLSLNIKKCIFLTPIGILLGNIVCKEGIKVDFVKIKIILDLKPPMNSKQVRVLLGHTGYYRKFIRYYSDMTYALEELLREDKEFDWIEECHISFAKLKIKIVEGPILRFRNWSTKFHVHIDASGMAIGAILIQPGDDGMDYPIVYSSRKLNKEEINYSTIENRKRSIRNGICIRRVETTFGNLGHRSKGKEPE